MKNQIQNAAALVPYEGLVLCFQKHFGKDYSLPCGKINSGELPSSAAIRETFEETGCVIQIVNGTPPILDWDDKNSLTMTFLGRLIVWGNLFSSSVEGEASWQRPEVLLQGKYPIYNGKVLRQFGRYLC